MILISNPDKSQWQEILKRPVMNTENLFDTVRSVIDRVKERSRKRLKNSRYYCGVYASSFITERRSKKGSRF